MRGPQCNDRERILLLFFNYQLLVTFFSFGRTANALILTVQEPAWNDLSLVRKFSKFCNEVYNLVKKLFQQFILCYCFVDRVLYKILA